MSITIFLKISLLLTVLICRITSFAQLQADAGEDKIICSDEFAVEIEIGGFPTASGGIPPYTYKWYGKFVSYEGDEQVVYDLGRMLDDSTKSNPVTYFHDIPEEWTKLYLKVEDSSGQVAHDTMNFIRAGIWRQLFYPSFQHMVKGDSIKLINPYIQNALNPLSYIISPSTGLSDSTDLNGWAKPESNTSYSIQAVNSLGCVSKKIDYMNIKVVDAKTDSVYKARLDSISELLIGEWEWYDSGGGHSWGFGGPKENGYTVNVVVEKDELSDSLLFSNFVNDTAHNKGKAGFHFYRNFPTTFEINSILPEIHDHHFVYPCFEYGPCDPFRMMHVEFFNDDSVRFYHEYCSDCHEVYFQRLKSTSIEDLDFFGLDLDLYPNPTNKKIWVSVPQNLIANKIELFNFLGQKIKNWNNLSTGENELGLENVLPGIYLVKIETEKGWISKKLVIQ